MKNPLSCINVEFSGPDAKPRYWAEMSFCHVMQLRNQLERILSKALVREGDATINLNSYPAVVTWFVRASGNNTGHL